MKLWLKAICIAFVLSVFYSMIPFQAQCHSISDDTFRLHILANSDSDADQALKLKVRDRVLRETGELFQSASDKQSAEHAAQAHLQEIADIAYDEVLKNGYHYPVAAQVVRMYFNTRHYEDYTLPSGMYDALRITIGNAEGHNWWCVMYPSICLSAAGEGAGRAEQAYGEEEYNLVTDNQIQYKFKFMEFFEKLNSLFR